MPAASGGAVSVRVRDLRNTKYDSAARRQGKRAGRERGCWLYVPAEELVAAGIDPYAPEPPYYRVWARRGGSVLVRLYRER